MVCKFYTNAQRDEERNREKDPDVQSIQKRNNICADDAETAIIKILDDFNAGINNEQLIILVPGVSRHIGFMRHHLSLEATSTTLWWFRSTWYCTQMDWLVCIKSSTICQDGLILSIDYICTSWVPQGSVIGQLIFAAYVSSIADVICSHGMLFHQFADDAQLCVAAQVKVDTADAFKIVSSWTHTVQNWFRLNDLLLNPDKSEVMVIGAWTQVKAYPCGDHVDVAGTLLKLRDNVKSLGVTFDRELSFDKHVKLVCL